MENPKVTFIKLDGSWYADLPQYIEQGGTLGECLMVAGAPQLIESLGGVDRLTVEISTDWISGCDAFLSKVYSTQTDDEGLNTESGPGWTYYAAIILLQQTNAGVGSQPYKTLNIGLCPVNAWVFGGTHPNTIFIKLANEEDK
jgi:hypothetical protein